MKHRAIFCAGITAVLSLLILVPLSRADEPAPATPQSNAPPAQPRAGYDKIFFLESADGRYRLEMTGYVQGYFDRKFLEAQEDTATFRIRRGRLKFLGHVYSKAFQYKLEYDFTSSKTLDAFLQYVESDAFHFAMGQFHVPFNFEMLVSSGNLEFVDRSLIHAYFGIPDEREPGAGIGGILFGKKIEYDLGVFNGEGPSTLNQNADFRYTGRLVWNVSGQHGYEMADTKDSATPQVAVGLGLMYNDTPDPTTIPVGGTKPKADKNLTSVTSDLSAKYRGISFHGGYFFQHNNPDIGSTSNDMGILASLGYFIVPTKIELVGRLAQLFLGAAHDRGEYTFGVNYFIHDGHRLKLQGDYSLQRQKDGIAAGNDRIDHQIRLQFQVKI